MDMSFIVEDCEMLFLYLYLCLSVMLNSLLCPFTSISFLLIKNVQLTLILYNITMAQLPSLGSTRRCNNSTRFSLWWRTFYLTYNAATWGTNTYNATSRCTMATYRLCLGTTSLTRNCK
jgi:hypothetical protein